jgi:hypothetical protein
MSLDIVYQTHYTLLSVPVRIYVHKAAAYGSMCMVVYFVVIFSSFVEFRPLFLTLLRSSFLKWRQPRRKMLLRTRRQRTKRNQKPLLLTIWYDVVLPMLLSGLMDVFSASLPLRRVSTGFFWAAVFLPRSLLALPSL